MISSLEENQFEEVSLLMTETIRHCIDAPGEVIQLIINDSVESTEWWLKNKNDGVHLVYSLDNQIIGTVLIKEYWNMTSLFVVPKYQGQGIASKLIDAALDICNEMSPIGKVKLNSSAFASEFYRRYGFEQIGEPKELLGGCIPYEYSFKQGN